MEVRDFWNQSLPIMDKAGKKIPEAKPAQLFFKHKAMTPNHHYFMREFRYWKKPSGSGVYPDLDGYLLVRVMEVSGFQQGIQMIPLNRSGRIAKGNNLRVRLLPFVKGVDLVSDSFRIFDVPSSGVLHIAPNAFSAFAASQIKGQRTWSPVMPEALDTMHIPSNLEEVWVWREQGYNDLTSVHCDNLIRLLLSKGIFVHVMDLDPMLEAKTWADAYRSCGIFAHKDKSSRFEACLKIAEYSEVSEFGMTIKNA